jgi:plasmid maintenance system antidote protein VapI
MTGTHFQPDWMSAPGTTIVDLLEQRSWSREEFAERTGYSLDRVDRLLSGRLTITDDVAEVLEELLGGSKQFWLSREDQYRGDIAYLQSKGSSEAAKAWLGELPIRDMKRFGWLSAARDEPDLNLAACLDFFGVSNVGEWRTKYSGFVSAVSFRTSLSFESQPGPVLAWLRYGEIKAAEIECRPWNASRFKKALKEIRRLTRARDTAVFLPLLKSLCAACGVAFVVARAPSGCHASGATRFITPEKAMILLSFRHLSDDQFWFTFFHEAGHLLLHSHKALFIEDGSEGNLDEEAEANAFSQHVLIPKEYQNELMSLPLNKNAIIRFSVRVGVSRGIVVGQLQHAKRLPQGKLNWLKRRFKWSQIAAD